MKVSNNDFFNSVVKELYCPTIDLRSVTKYEIFKALPSTAYPGSYSSTIRLFDASNSIVCVIFYSGYSNSSDEALKALMINPLVFDAHKARNCFNELAVAHKQYLPQFKEYIEELESKKE